MSRTVQFSSVQYSTAMTGRMWYDGAHGSTLKGLVAAKQCVVHGEEGVLILHNMLHNQQGANTYLVLHDDGKICAGGFGSRLPLYGLYSRGSTVETPRLLARDTAPEIAGCTWLGDQEPTLTSNIEVYFIRCRLVH